MVFWLLCGFPDEETSGWDVSSYKRVNACAFLSGGCLTLVSQVLLDSC